MTALDAMKAALGMRDTRKLGRVVDHLRGAGFDYAAIYSVAKRATGIELAEWDALMEEIDDADSDDG